MVGMWYKAAGCFCSKKQDRVSPFRFGEALKVGPKLRLEPLEAMAKAG